MVPAHVTKACDKVVGHEMLKWACLRNSCQTQKTEVQASSLA
jgi:hypothetical protein